MIWNVDGLDCIYCGMPASHRDHVTPHSYDSINPKDRTWGEDEVVPACKECNCLLSNYFLTSIAERADYIARVLETRYRKILASPDWTPEEYKSLGRGLRSFVKKNQHKKKVVKVRIEYAVSRSQDINLTPETYWEVVNGANASQNTPYEDSSERQD